MLITEIMEYLDAQGVVTYDPTGIGGNIFMNVLPSSPDEAVMLEPTGGFPGDTRHLQYSNPTIRTLIRGTQDPRVGYNLAKDIYNNLHGLCNMRFISEGLWVVSCKGVQSKPVSIGRDENGRHRFSLNYQLEVRESRPDYNY